MLSRRWSPAQGSRSRRSRSLRPLRPPAPEREKPRIPRAFFGCGATGPARNSSTWFADCPDLCEAERTSSITLLNSAVRAAVSWTFCAISRVASPCEPTDAAMAEAMELTSWVASVMAPMPPAASCEARWTFAIWSATSAVARVVCSASDFTSCATTANPRPLSPARAASIVALSASILVCWAMPVIISTMPPICWMARAEFVHAAVGLVGLLLGIERNVLRTRGLPADFLDGMRQLLCGRCDRADVGRRRFRRAGADFSLFAGVTSLLRQRPSDRFQLMRRAGHGGHDPADSAFETLRQCAHFAGARLRSLAARCCALGHLRPVGLVEIVPEGFDLPRHVAQFI